MHHYSLVFERPSNFRVLASSNSLSKLKEARCVSGDIVINSDMTVNQSDEWLWDWEKNDPRCYARICQEHGWSR